jgi:hypothetical protein
MDRRKNKYYRQVQSHERDNRRKSSLLHAALWILAIIVFIVFWFWIGGCSLPNIRQDEQSMWNDLKKEYPQSQAKRPVVVYNNKFKGIGVYLPNLNLIVTRKYYDVLKHEMRHAYGDMLGEGYNATR